jgi:hypothetical protein
MNNLQFGKINKKLKLTTTMIKWTSNHQQKFPILMNITKSPNLKNPKITIFLNHKTMDSLLACVVVLLRHESWLMKTGGEW